MRGARLGLSRQTGCIGPLPSSQGHSWAFPCSRHLFKVWHCHLHPHSRLGGGHTIQRPFPRQLCYIFKSPKSIPSDNGATLVVKSTQQWAAPWDSHWIFHALGHPQATGAIERWNGLLKGKLREITRQLRLSSQWNTDFGKCGLSMWRFPRRVPPV